jgi:UDP-glucose 4-epimerase
MKILVTGGAGFIGSHLVEFLISEGHTVLVFDNLSTGQLAHLGSVQASPRFAFVKADIKDAAAVDAAVKGQDLVFHLCDNSDIRYAASHTADYIDQNILGGFQVLEAMKRHGVKQIAFPSSTTVLGDATVVPTPEHYGPLFPMNIYGGAKLAMEALLSAYAYTFDFQVWIFRFVDIVGGRIDHGVIHDFIKKLRANPKELEILGDGSQTRSFMIIDDCVSAIWKSVTQLQDKVNLVHIGNGDRTSITQVGHLVCAVLGLQDVGFRYTGGKKGWKGDAFTNYIASNSLDRLGWKARLGSEAAVTEAARRLSAG